MSRKKPGARLARLTAVLTSTDDRMLIAATEILRTELGGLTVIAAPNSELLKQYNSDIEIFLGDTSVESQAELCIQRTVQQFGRVDLLISISPERLGPDGLAFSVSGVGGEIDLEFHVDDDPDSEMRLRDFDHLLYSKIRSIYLLSRFVRRAKRLAGVSGESTDFVLARVQSTEKLELKQGSPSNAVLGAVRSWMESYATGSAGGRWMEISGLDQLVSNLCLATRASSNSDISTDFSIEAGAEDVASNMACKIDLPSAGGGVSRSLAPHYQSADSSF